VHTPFYSMVNLVAGRRVVPEFIQDQFQPQAVARDVRLLLESAELRDGMRQQFRDLAEKLRAPSARTASISGNQPRSSDADSSPDDKFADPIQRAAGIVESFLQGGRGQWDRKSGNEPRGFPDRGVLGGDTLR